MDKLLPHLYSTYGTYVNTDKMIPLIADGLLPVQRRVLLSLHQIAKNQLTPTVEVTGHCVSRYHPHNLPDDTVAWAVTNNFASGSGNWGSQIGIDTEEPAASRYTKVRLTPLTEQLAFEYVDYVKWEEKEKEKEPCFLPTMIPFCLMCKYQISNMGFGYKTVIPTFTYKDLMTRLYSLLDNKKITIKPTIIGCDILSDKTKLEELLTTGQASLDISGKYEISKLDNIVYVYGWGAQREFSAFINKIDRYKNLHLWTNKDINYLDCSTAKTGTKIAFSVNKQRNIDVIFKQLVEAIKEALKTQVHYHIYVVDIKGKVRTGSVDEMLLTCYNLYKKVFNKYCTTEIENCQKKIDKLTIIKSIRPFLSEALAKTKTLIEASEYLSKKTGIASDLIKEVATEYRISSLMSVPTDISEIETEMRGLEDDLKNIDKVIKNKYHDLLKV